MKKVKLTSALLKRIIFEEKQKIKIEKQKKALLEKKRINTYIRLIKSIEKSQHSSRNKNIVLEAAKRKLIKKIKRSL